MHKLGGTKAGLIASSLHSYTSLLLSYTTHQIVLSMGVLSMKFMQEGRSYNHELIETKLGPKTLTKDATSSPPVDPKYVTTF